MAEQHVISFGLPFHLQLCDMSGNSNAQKCRCRFLLASPFKSIQAMDSLGRALHGYVVNFHTPITTGSGRVVS